MQNNHKKIDIKQSDLLELEKDLSLILKDFISFNSLSFYFPVAREEFTTSFLPEEALLLAPLNYHDKRVGMIRVEGIDKKAAKAILPFIEKIASLALEKTLQEKLGHREPDTGLVSEEYLYRMMEDTLDSVRNSQNIPDSTYTHEQNLYKLCLGMIIIRWQDENFASRQHDHQFSLHLYKRLAQILARNVPEDALAASSGKFEGQHEFVILFNTPGRKACHKLAREILEKMLEERFSDRLSGKKYQPQLLAGHALYPQDMAGDEMALPLIIQALKLRDRARLAATLINVTPYSGIEERILAFSNIIKKGGIVLDYQGKDKVRINIGKNANLKAGTRFFVWGKNPHENRKFLKGQLSVISVDATESIAEIFYLNQAEHLPEKGDSLTQSEDAYEDYIYGEDNQASILDGEISGRQAFLESLPRLTKAASRFVIIICRYKSFTNATLNLEDLLQSFIAELDKNTGSFAKPFIGEYGKERLIIFWPDMNASNAAKIFSRMAETLPPDVGYACGIAQYPYLDFGKAEIERNALKALEYAELLPAPHIGIFDSMAMTISADKKFSLGDNYAAIEEYKKAILADPANVVARTSLGVCMAALGKVESAKKLWMETLEYDMDPEMRAKVYYNLGTLCQKNGENQIASFWYRHCLKCFQKHVFAWLRLGQLNEERGRRKSARRYYICAANLAEAESEVFGIAHRFLARLDASESNENSARSALHKLLLKNPADRASMHLLAELYLKEDGDPAISAMLARKSLQIKESREAWELLARSLSMSGNENDAKIAMLRAEKDRNI